MNFKTMVVRTLLRWADGWDKEVHYAIEANVMSKYNEMFPGAGDKVAQVEA